MAVFSVVFGMVSQCRISRGKRLICYLMQLNSICQAILFTCPWRDWGIRKRMRAIYVFPEVVWREGTDSSVLDFRTVLWAAHLQYELAYIFLKFLFGCFWKGICIPFIHIFITKKGHYVYFRRPNSKVSLPALELPHGGSEGSCNVAAALQGCWGRGCAALHDAGERATCCMLGCCCLGRVEVLRGNTCFVPQLTYYWFGFM